MNKEKKIVREILKVMLAQGFVCSIDNGNDSINDRWEIEKSSSVRAIMAKMFGVGEETLVFYEKRAESHYGTVPSGWARVGFIFLVYGNGEDVVADCGGPEYFMRLVDGITNPVV